MNVIETLRTDSRLPKRHSRATTLIFGLIFGAMSLGTIAPAVLEAEAGPESGSADQPVLAISAQDATEQCALDGPEVASQAWIRTELFFGTAKPDGTAVTDAQWRTFLDGEITGRFPDGLTVLTAAGQWQSEDGKIVQERSKVVVLLYPMAAAVESGEKIEAIRAAYEQEFRQESVLRADDSRPVCTSF